MLIIVAGMLIFDHFISKPNNRRLNEDIVPTPLVNVSTNPVIQNAYERCHNRAYNNFQADNTHLPEDVMKITLESMPNICEELFRASCKSNDHTNKKCEFALIPYLNE